MASRRVRKSQWFRAFTIFPDRISMKAIPGKVRRFQDAICRSFARHRIATYWPHPISSSTSIRMPENTDRKAAWKARNCAGPLMTCP